MALLPLFFRWYYTQGTADLVRNIGAVISGLARFFSFGRIFRTLFSPWRRLHDSYTGGIEDRMATLTANIATRIFGAVVRLVVVLLGAASLAVAAAASLVAFVSWVAAPALVPFLVALGLRALIS
jgi:hypothetical protein